MEKNHTVFKDYSIKAIEVEIKDNEVHEIDMDNLDLLIKK